MISPTVQNEAEKIRPLRVALITGPEYIEAWSDLFVTTISALVANGIAVMVVCPDERSIETVSRVPIETAIYPQIDIKGFAHFNKRMLLEKLRRFAPNVLHCMCQSRAAVTNNIARNLDIPYVLNINSLRPNWRIAVNHKRLYRVITPAQSVCNSLAREFPKLAQKAVAVSPGCFVSSGSVSFEKPDHIPGLVAHFPGNADENYDIFFNALKHLIIEGYELQMAVVCAEGIEKRLRSLSNALGLNESVIFVPHVRFWREVAMAGDIFLRARPDDQFDPLLLEAMACGAAIAACSGGVDDILHEGENCVMFDPQNELSVIGVIKKLLDQRDFAKRLGEQGLKYVLENHSVSEMIESLIQIYSTAEMEKPRLEAGA